MSIKAMMHMPYTEHRDFVALSADLSELPYDCGDGSTCIMSDTAQSTFFINQRMNGEKRHDLFQSWHIEEKLKKMNSVTLIQLMVICSLSEKHLQMCIWFIGMALNGKL